MGTTSCSIIGCQTKPLESLPPMPNAESEAVDIAGEKSVLEVKLQSKKERDKLKKTQNSQSATVGNI